MFAVNARADNQYAILVGVSDYPFLDDAVNLVGPRNDVLLMFEVLKQKGIPEDHLYLLTENHPRAVAPTRDNIFNHLAKVLTTSEQGDFVYLHFSGHGSQQPAAIENDEIDGMDEIFLPADTKHWQSSTRRVENAITDDEISVWLDKFRDKGVFVWLVFDSCHSGTMSRSQWQSRKVPGSVLGVPKSRSTALDSGPPLLLTRETLTDQKGGYVAFFAAQTTEETPEMPLPKNAESAQRYGLFTYHLIQSITQHPAATYRQIAENIIQNYSAQLWFGSRPVFTGDQLDAPVFTRQASRDTPVQWRINKHEAGYEIPAGSLLGHGQGSLFAILPSPTSDLTDTLGFATSTEVEALTSQLRMISHKQGSKQYGVLEQIPATAFARLIESRLDTQLSVSMASSSASTSPEIEQVIQKIKQTGIPPIKLVWKLDNEPADVQLLPEGRHLTLLTDGEPVPCRAQNCIDRSYHRIPISDIETSAAALETSLRTIAKAKGLLKLGTVLGGDALDVSLNVKRKRDNKLETFDGTTIPTLYSGDKLTLTIANFIEQPLDITVLFVSSDFGIAVAFPRKNQFNRFMEEEEKVIPLGTVNTETVGFERIIVIATQATRSASATNFAYLAQDGITARNNPTPISTLISEAGFGNSVQPRGDMPVSTSVRDQADIKTISWVTAKHP